MLLQEYQIEYDARHHRIRCQGHIINLVAHSLIFITDSENLEAENDIPTITVAELKEWRKKGPVGKLHNLAVDLARSVQHERNSRCCPIIEAFLKIMELAGIPGNV